MIIGIDFDGTCVTHEYPNIGKDIGAVSVIKDLIKNGHKIVLFTMRSDVSYIDDALEWFKSNDIPLYGINTDPNQLRWTNSPKAFADIYIDDAALGCPLKYEECVSYRPFVDWNKVRKMLKDDGIL